jgi:hypothetical protein
MEKIYEFQTDQSLTAARRKVVDEHIVRYAHLSPKPFTHSWDEEEKGVLHFTAEPIFAQVRFQSKKVELYAKAPLWARLLFTEKKKLQLKEQIESMLEKTGFVSPPKKARK